MVNSKVSSNLIYVSSPYTHSDSSVVENRMKCVTEYLAQLSAERKIAFSPLLMHYCFDCGVELPKDYDFWRNHCLTLLSKSDVMHVLLLPGWEDSNGVKDEMDFTLAHNIPFEFINFQ